MQGSNRVEVQVKLNDIVIFRKCDVFLPLANDKRSLFSFMRAYERLQLSTWRCP